MKHLFPALYTQILLPLTLGTLAACSGSSGFSGAAASIPASSQATAAPTATAPTAATGKGAGSTQAVTSNAATNASVAGKPDLAPTSTAALKPPTTAITQGSFTVWTNPTTPVGGESYQVYVQVTLPTNLSSYTVTDLTGSIHGTDGYTQAIGAAPDVVGNQTFQFSGTTALLSATVPGGNPGVQDTITVHSALLAETQTIGLTFASDGNLTGSGWQNGGNTGAGLVP